MKKDKRLIPHGFYCYSAKGKCPYWSIRKGKPRMRNGYCSFLEKGDWNFNKEGRWTTKVRTEKGKYVEGPAGTADELGIIGSWLWDQVKMCRLKEWPTKTGPSRLIKEKDLNLKKKEKKNGDSKKEKV